MSELAIIREGVLSTTGFPGLIYSILAQKETGVLTLTEETAEKSIFIRKGRPIFASSTDRDDRLGQVFFQAGKVSLEGLLTAVERSLAEKKQLGRILVEMKLIEPQDLVEGLRTQVRNIFCSLFLWTRGRFRYAPGTLPSEDVITLNLNTGNIILEGIRRIESWERIWEAVGGRQAGYRTTGKALDLLEDLQLSLEEWILLSHLEQPIGLLDLCRASSMKDFEICRLLWAFLTLGIVTRESAGA
jgi:hypothetical protein